MEKDDFVYWVSSAILQACDVNNRAWQKKKIKAQQSQLMLKEEKA